MKRCYCIKSHIKIDDYVKRKIYQYNTYYIDDSIVEKNIVVYIILFNKDFTDCIAIDCSYRKIKFEKYFTTDIEIIRKLKLKEIRKLKLLRIKSSSI